ncbi:MAG: 50S ribosomal protein L10 [Deltaproteobacteria bacterium]|nr:50S ribosomal protein L10 [Deltaproteobacteria bacterium]
MNRTEKKEEIDRLKAEFVNIQAAVVADFRGLKVEEINSLRGALRKEGVKFRVVKNTLARIAAKGTGLEAAVDEFVGPTGLAYSDSSPVGPAKAMTDAAKANEKLKLRGGCLQGKALDVAGLKALASMPSLDTLRAQFLGLLQTPASQFVRVLAAAPGGLVNVLDARKRQLEKGE